jgi:hypothetical protein
MKEREDIRKRFLQDSIPVRLGNLAANLSRIKSFTRHDESQEAVGSLIDESRFFIEWTAAETEIDTAAELVELQVQLSRWRRDLDRVWSDSTARQNVAEASSRWSNRILELSGLLG